MRNEATKDSAKELIALSNPVATYLRFFWAGLVKHGQTGGIVPSQRFLIAKMIAPIPETYRGQVVELGAWRVRSTRLWRATIDATSRGQVSTAEWNCLQARPQTCSQKWAKNKSWILSSPAFRWRILAEKKLWLSSMPSAESSAQAECTSNFSIHCWTAGRSEPGSRTCAPFPHF
jgi:hypothetical protein